MYEFAGPLESRHGCYLGTRDGPWGVAVSSRHFRGGLSPKTTLPEQNQRLDYRRPVAHHLCRTDGK
jgi:hypothetical protein